MPIKHDVCARELSRKEYHDLDYQVMGHVFRIHNELGNLHDERIYQGALKAACDESKLQSHREVAIALTHSTFEKVYYVDLLVDNGIAYELKVSESLNHRHKMQLLNYMMLLGVRKGKLVNFRSKSVESEYVSTNITPEFRYRYTIWDEKWISTGERSDEFRQCVIDLLKDWGSYLAIGLYREALVHLLGGAENIIVQTPVIYNGIEVGKSRSYLLDEKNCFAMTGFMRPMSASNHVANLMRYLEHSPFKYLHWVNLGEKKVVFETLENPEK